MISILTKSTRAVAADTMTVTATTATVTIAADGSASDKSIIASPTGISQQSKSSLADTSSSSSSFSRYPTSSTEILAHHVGGIHMVPLDSKDSAPVRLTKNRLNEEPNPSPFFSSGAFPVPRKSSGTYDVVMGEPVELDNIGLHGMNIRPINTVPHEAKSRENTIQAEIYGLKNENKTLQEELHMVKGQLKITPPDVGGYQHPLEAGRPQSHAAHAQEAGSTSEIHNHEFLRIIEAMKEEHEKSVVMFEKAITKLNSEADESRETIVSLSRRRRQQEEHAGKYEKERDDLLLKVAASELAFAQLKAEKDQLSAKLENVLDGDSRLHDLQKRLEEMHAKHEEDLTRSDEAYMALKSKYSALKKTNEGASKSSDRKNGKERALDDDKTLVASEFGQLISKSKPLAALSSTRTSKQRTPEKDISSRLTDQRNESSRGRKLTRTISRFMPYSFSRNRTRDSSHNAADIDNGLREYADDVGGRMVPIQDMPRDTGSYFPTPEKVPRSSPIPLPPTPQSIGKGTESNISGDTVVSSATDDSERTLIEGGSIKRTDGKPAYLTPPALLVRTPSDRIETDIFSDDNAPRSGSRSSTLKGLRDRFASGFSSREPSPSGRRKSTEPVSPTPKAKSPSRGQAKHHAMTAPVPRSGSPGFAASLRMQPRKGATSPVPQRQLGKRKQENTLFPELPHVGPSWYAIPPEDNRQVKKTKFNGGVGFGLGACQ